MKRKNKKRVSLIRILFFVWLTFTLNISFPQRALAEGLAISGLQFKTTEFKPYLEKGQFSYFLNQPASVTVEIQDNDFNLVRKIQFMKMEEAGENIIMWDGKDEKGNFIKSGEYFLSVNAMGGQAMAVASSIGMKISLDAPAVKDFRMHVSQLEGRQKKQYPIETPTRLKSKNWCATCLRPLVWPIGTVLATILVLSGEWADARDVWFSTKAQKEFFSLESVLDLEKYEKMKKDVDEHNAKIDAEIAKHNREIDAYNQKIKNSVTIRITSTE